MDTNVLEDTEVMTPVHTVIQPGADGDLRAYPKGTEPPIVMLPNGRNPFPLQPVSMPSFTTQSAPQVAPLQAAPKADEPDPNSIEGMAKALGLRESYDMDDRASDAYSSWMPWRNEPLFYLDLDDTAKEYRSVETLAIEKLRASFGDIAKDRKITAAQLLERQNERAQEIGWRTLALNDYVLEQAYRGCKKIKDWRRLHPTQKGDIVTVIVQSCNLGNNDAQLLMMR